MFSKDIGLGPIKLLSPIVSLKNEKGMRAYVIHTLNISLIHITQNVLKFIHLS